MIAPENRTPVVTEQGAESWALSVTGPLTDTELRATPVEVSAPTLESEIGGTNEAAAPTDTSVSGVNGLFKRGLQRLTALLALLPSSLGQKLMALSFPVVLPSDQTVQVSGTITTSGTVNNTPNRPSQGAGRTHVSAAVSNVNSDQTVYTVTAGKTFYMTTLILSAFNSSIGSVGVLILKDGGAGGTVKIPYLMQQAGVGALVSTQPLVPGNNTFQEPVQFTTNVFMDVAGGSVTYSVGIVGYEE